jgi:hypothetical protein
MSTTSALKNVAAPIADLKPRSLILSGAGVVPLGFVAQGDGTVVVKWSSPLDPDNPNETLAVKNGAQYPGQIETIVTSDVDLLFYFGEPNAGGVHVGGGTGGSTSLPEGAATELTSQAINDGTSSLASTVIELGNPLGDDPALRVKVAYMPTVVTMPAPGFTASATPDTGAEGSVVRVVDLPAAVLVGDSGSALPVTVYGAVTVTGLVNQDPEKPGFTRENARPTIPITFGEIVTDTPVELSTLDVDATASSPVGWKLRNAGLQTFFICESGDPVTEGLPVERDGEFVIPSSTLTGWFVACALGMSTDIRVAGVQEAP